MYNAPAANRTGRVTSVKRASISPTMGEIQRAAGWWGGEGSVSSDRGHLRVTIAQKEIEVLEWMQSRFGGSIHKKKSGSAPHLEPCHAWSVHGPRERGFLQTIYSCLPESPRRQAQIYDALVATMKIKKRGPQPKAVCGKGHPKKIGGDCRPCANEAARLRRLKPEVQAKHRAEGRSRYWANPELFRAYARKRGAK